MHLTWRDGMATIAVAVAAVGYGLWQTGTVLKGTSTRAVAVAAFALGWLACTSDAKRMASAYSPQAQDRPPASYTAVGSLLGLVALIAGVWAIVASSETMLAVLIGTMVVLWLMATGRHMMTADEPRLVAGRTVRHA